MIKDMAGAKDVVLQGAIMNLYTENDEKWTGVNEDLVELLEIDTDKDEIILDDTYYMDYIEGAGDHYIYVQKFVTYVATNTIDFVLIDNDNFPYQAYQQMFLSVEEYLTAEQLELYADNFIYIDWTVVEEIDAITDEGDLEAEYPEYIYGDAEAAESMEVPIAVGIRIDDDMLIAQGSTFLGDYGVFGVIANTQNLDNVKAFIEYGFQVVD